MWSVNCFDKLIKNPNLKKWAKEGRGGDGMEEISDFIDKESKSVKNGGGVESWGGGGGG